MAKYYTPKEVAAMEEIEKDPKTIRRWCIMGIIQAKKIGGTWKISQETVDKIKQGC